MSTPPLSDDVLIECLAVWRRNDCSVTNAASDLGINRKTLESRLHSARARGLHLSDGARTVISGAGLDVSEARGGWLHSYDSEGKKIGATRWTVSEEEAGETLAERLRGALEGLKPAEPVTPPESVEADLCNVFPLFDVHFGMRAWGEETRGQDYDLRHATADLRSAFESVLLLTPPAQEAVLLIGGDFFHADDNRAETPAHRHKLDVDGRYNKVIDEAVEVLGYVIDRIRARHKLMTICVLRGNHDEHSHVALRVGIGQRYRLDERVNVETSFDGLFMRQWGKSAIFAHHGDKAPPERQALYLSDVCPFWSETRHRHYYTGHIHKDTARDLGPLRWESLRAFCPPDAYASSMGFASRRALKVDTYHRIKGRVASAFDPIERELSARVD